MNQIAARIVERLDAAERSADEGKNPHAVALGRLGGLKGGRARAEKLSERKRRTIAQKAAKARWSRTGSVALKLTPNEFI